MTFLRLKGMTKSVLLSVRITPKLSAKLERLAKNTGRTKSWLVDRILGDHIDYEIETVARIREGMKAVDEGRTISHEEVFAQLRARIAARSRRKAAE
jgi:predicted transcriptional regulator